MRISTKMMFNNYNSNLNASLNLKNRTMQRATDYRVFEKASENPFTAAQAFQIRRELYANANYQSNLSSVKNVLSTADSTLGTVATIIANTGSSDVLAAINGTMNQSDRNTIADKLDTMKESLLTDLNLKQGNQYLFGGAASGAETAPFSVVDGQLYYRGINVDTGENINGASTTISYTANGKDKTMQMDFGKDIGKQLNGYSFNISVDTTGAISQIDAGVSGTDITITVPQGTTKSELQSFLQDSSTGFGKMMNDQGILSDAGNAEGITLSGLPENGSDTVQDGTSQKAVTDMGFDSLLNETAYVDIGLGLKTDADGNIVDQSAFNTVISGLKILGYGTTTDGGDSIPNNAYSLMTDIANMLRDDSLSNAELVKKIKPYQDALTPSHDNVLAQRSAIGNREAFLTNTQNYLESLKSNLSDRDDELEVVDITDAYSDYSWQYYCYQAALQVGSTVFQSTLMDYMS